MKRLATLLAVMILVLALSAAVQATVTLSFDPDALIQAYPADSTGLKASQPDARRFHGAWASSYYGTFSDYMQAGHSQPGDYDTYMNWRDGLGSGEGIAMFNSWFLDASIVRSWGEIIVIKPGTTVTGTAADGWNVRVIDSPYGLGGSSVQWWTTDSSKYINTVSNIGQFSITADLYWDLDADGWDADDTAVVAGDSVRFWAGNLNGDDPEFYRSDTQALYFDNLGWGNRTSSVNPFSAHYSQASGDQGPGFEAALTVSAVPEPATMLLLGLGALSLLRKRKA